MGANELFEMLGKRDECLITDMMPKVVVDLLEEIEVGDDDAALQSNRQVSANIFVEQAFEFGPVSDLRQRVEHRDSIKIVELFLKFLLCRSVEHNYRGPEQFTGIVGDWMETQFNLNFPAAASGQDILIAV